MPGRSEARSGMSPQTVDHAALAPAYAVAAAAVLVLLLDLAWPGRRGALLVTAALGPVAAAVLAVAVSGERRATFCTSGGQLPGGVDVGASCSLVLDRAGAVAIVVFCALALVVLGYSATTVESGSTPAGEYAFLLLCSLFGGVVLATARDLLTLVVALETLTLPVYVLVGLRRRELRSAEAATTFFVVSVVSTAVTLLGAGFLYALTGAVHLDRIAAALGARDDLRTVPLTAAAVALVLVGLAFKVAAVPFHAWAPGTYDGAPVPVATYLSTASKLGGVLALLLVAVGALRPYLDVAGPVLAAVAVATMTVGNLVALWQRRMVRLLAWSSVAQAGYLLAPLGAFATAAGRTDASVRAAVTGVVAYTLFYVLINVGAFGTVVAWRGAGDGGEIGDYRGLARRSPWVAGAFVLALAGLAGLPPGLAGLFAKVTVVRSLLDGAAGWLAIVVAVNAVIGLAYYVRVAAVCFAAPGAGTAGVAVPPATAAVPAAGPGGAGTTPASDPGSTAGAASTMGGAGSVAVVARGPGAGAAVAEALAEAVGPPTAGPPGQPVPEEPAKQPPGRWAVLATLGSVSLAAVVAGFAPQLVLDAAKLFADLWT
jgi:NADH-quinone oxidoreductase subunit N